MKKTLWLALILLLVCIFAFSACDNGDTPSNNDNSNSQQTTEGNIQNNNGGENNNSSTPICQHTFGSWSTVKQATCKEEGKLVRTCSKCSETEESTVSKTDIHTEVVDAAISATCTADGKTEGKHCSVCGKTIVTQTTIKALGHTEVVDPAVASTCEEEGLTEGKHCSVCNTILVKQTKISILAHNYKNGICSICKNIDQDAKAAEIKAENARHEQEFADINTYYNNVVSGLEERVSNLMELNGITYVYDDSYCYNQISELSDEISELERKIATLSGSTNSSDIAKRQQYESQVTAKENEQNKYYKCITINALNNEIIDNRAYQSEAIAEENILHEDNLAIIENKYKCYEERHTLVVLEAKDPTCEENGLTEGLYCEDCQRCYIEQITILSEGHKIDESTGCCTICKTDVAEIGFVFEWLDKLNGYQLVEYVGSDVNVIVPSKYKGKDVISIGTVAFNDCTHILNVVIPDSVYIINSSAFSGCSSIQSITLPFIGSTEAVNGEEYLSEPLDTWMPSSLCFGTIFGTKEYEGSMAISSSIYTFYIPESLTSVTITGGYIYYRAFAFCSNIEYIWLGDAVTHIGNDAFSYCSSLKAINISSGVESIGRFAFTSCSALESINVSEENDCFISIDGNLYSIDKKTLIKYPSAKSEKSFEIPDGVTTIGAYAFYDSQSLTTIVIPKSVTQIDMYAMRFCSQLSTIEFQGTVEQWEHIFFDFWWNDSIGATTVTCSNGSVTIE